MATNNTEQYTIQKGGYVAFDATSLRQLIIDRLNEQKVFTDQNFVGSNLASIIDIIAYSYNTLIYYLNKTSTESMFSEAQLYENINRIVKLIDYSPIGFQTSTLSFLCSATNFSQGISYTIPRYSYILINNIPYSFNEDITFIKQLNGTEFLTEVSQQKLLYQGFYQEYPNYTASGENNEVVILNTADEQVDHFNIDVYVKPILTGVWEQYTKTTSLYLEDSSAKKYELRLNGNYRYEIRFGNDINGKKLQTGDIVAIYYLKSQGTQGEVGPEALTVNNSFLVRYNTIQYNTILTDILKNQYRLVQSNEGTNFLFNNTSSSTPVKLPESVDDIRQSAPANYRTQYRLVTTKDYETFIRTNFANLIADVKTINNWQYVSTYLKYFYDIGIQDPLKTERALLNQVLYADACNFNNVYLIVVPRSGTQNFDYLVPAQKELINSSILSNKMATTETVFIDPVYKAIDFGIADVSTNFDPVADSGLYSLEVIKKTSSRRDNQSIINDIVNIFTKYFSRNSINLGQIVDVNLIIQQILSVEGVQALNTVNIDGTQKATGLSLFVWNPVYPENDKQVTRNNISFQAFEFPYFNNLSTLANRIKVTTTSTVFETVEY